MKNLYSLFASLLVLVTVMGGCAETDDTGTAPASDQSSATQTAELASVFVDDQLIHQTPLQEFVAGLLALQSPEGAVATDSDLFADVVELGDGVFMNSETGDIAYVSPTDVIVDYDGGSTVRYSGDFSQVSEILAAVAISSSPVLETDETKAVPVIGLAVVVFLKAISAKVTLWAIGSALVSRAGATAAVRLCEEFLGTRTARATCDDRAIAACGRGRVQSARLTCLSAVSTRAGFSSQPACTITCR